MPIDADHPTEELLFYIIQDITDEMPALVKQAIERLTQSRSWLLTPPEYVDEIGEGDEENDRILGGALTLYSTLPPHRLSLEDDRRQWEEANAFIRMFQDLSSKHHWELYCHYREEMIDVMDDGIMGPALTDAFLGEWKRNLERRAGTTPS